MQIGLSLSLTNVLLSSVSFSPSVLFASSEPGVWYDPSDLTTLFTDTAGTTPVTTPGQTVALMLDKSKGLTLGTELVTNGGFDSADGWVTAAGTTISGGVCSAVSAASGVEIVRQDAIPASDGVTFEVAYNVTSVSTGTLRIQLNQGELLSAPSSVGTHRVFIRAGATTRGLSFIATGTTSITIDNVSVRELPGNHATQPTAAARPTYGIVPATGRRNLLTRTEEFDNAAWLKVGASVTASAGLAPDGTTTASLLTVNSATSVHLLDGPNVSFASGSPYSMSVYMKQGTSRYGLVSLKGAPFPSADADNRFVIDLDTGLPVFTGSALSSVNVTSAGGGWWRVRITNTADATITALSCSIGVSNAAGDTSFAGDGTSAILIWGAQVEAGSTATDYQRVTTQYDVTETGVTSLGYLAFDGVDDFMVTPTITPGTDKAQVFAGVRKLSDAASGVLFETSTTSDSNNGTVLMLAPGSSGLQSYALRSRGTIAANTLPGATHPAPSTNVVTGLGDIPGDSVILRVDGVETAQATTDQGTGNFLAYPIYIGRRAGTSVPFNGHIYSLITRFGDNLDANLINQSETYVAGKTGVTL